MPIKHFPSFIFKLLFPKRVKEIEMLRASIEEAQKQLLEKNMKIQILSKSVEILRDRITNLEQSADESRNFKSAAIDFFQNSILKDQIASLPEFLSKLEKNKLNGAVISGANSGGLPPNVKLLKGSFKSDSDTELIDYMATRFSQIATDEQIGAGVLSTLLNDGEKMMSDYNHGQNFVADRPYLAGSAGKFGGAGGSGSFEPNNEDSFRTVEIQPVPSFFSPCQPVKEDSKTCGTQETYTDSGSSDSGSSFSSD